MAAEKLENPEALAELLNASTPLTAEELRQKIHVPDNLAAFRKQFSRDKGH